MDLECLKNNNEIVSDGLAIFIDLTDIRSWNLNTGFTSFSITKWKDAKVSNLDLLDFGLTAYDNGRVNDMISTLNVTADETKLSLFRIGFNDATGGTFYTDLNISGITAPQSNVGNYFQLDGGYLQGFFKIQGQTYELLPPRFNNGVTIENLIKIDEFNDSIFFLMGARAEDKYNPLFSGETKIVITTETERVPSGVVGQVAIVITIITGFSGVSTSQGNFLNAFLEEERLKISFSDFADSTKIVPVKQPNNNTYDNVIAFMLNTDGKLGVKRINSDGVIISEISPKSLPTTGWTLVSFSFEPEEILDPDVLDCAPNRNGTLIFYVNGREFWRLNDYEEFFFKDFKNNYEKVIGVPYNISWGGGSFGLKHSFHFDILNTTLYDGQNTQYIKDNFTPDTFFPFNDDPCFTGGSDPSLGNVSLSADSKTFVEPDPCDPNIENPITVIRVDYTGTTAQTPSNTYYIEFDTPIEMISNRDYDFQLDLFDTGIFQTVNVTGNTPINSISIALNGTEDIEVVNQTVYKSPVTRGKIENNTIPPFPILPDVFEYVDGETGLLINGQTGFPVSTTQNQIITSGLTVNRFVTGVNMWNTIKLKARLKNNTGRQNAVVGILIESTEKLIEDFLIFFDNFKYRASEKLAQDPTKDNLLIEQNFNSSLKGGLQKLRIYDRTLTGQEILHNAKVEIKNNPNLGFNVTTGGRIIKI